MSTTNKIASDVETGISAHWWMAVVALCGALAFSPGVARAQAQPCVPGPNNGNNCPNVCNANDLAQHPIQCCVQAGGDVLSCACLHGGPCEGAVFNVACSDHCDDLGNNQLQDNQLDANGKPAAPASVDFYDGNGNLLYTDNKVYSVNQNGGNKGYTLIATGNLSKTEFNSYFVTGTSVPGGTALPAIAGLVLNVYRLDGNPLAPNRHFEVSGNSIATATALYAAHSGDSAAITGSIAAETARAEAAETTINNSLTTYEGVSNGNLAAEIARAKSAEAALSTGLAAETSRAESVEGSIEASQTVDEGNISSLIASRMTDEAKIATLNSNLAFETTRATNAEMGLSSALTAYEGVAAANLAGEVTRATNAESGLSTSIAGEVTRATNAELGLSNALTSYEGVAAANLAGEVTRATNAELGLSNALASYEGVAAANLAAEVTRATNAELGLSTSITGETTRAINAETGLSNALTAYEGVAAANLAGEVSRATTAEMGLSMSIAGETTRATNAELGLSMTIAGEVTRATNAETGLSMSITGETTRAMNAETGLSNALTAYEGVAATNLAGEVTRATNAETGLANALTAYEGVAAANLAGEVTRATNAELGLSMSIAGEVTRATNAELGLSMSITGETTRAINAETGLSNALTAYEGVAATNLAGEVTRATNAELGLSASITGETTRATNAETGLSNALTAYEGVAAANLAGEVTRATNAEGTISTALASYEASLKAVGTLNAAGNPVDWSELKNVPSFAASGYSAGTGIAISGANVVSNTGVLSVSGGGNIASTGGANPSISLTGIVPVANGGTGSATQNFVDLTSNQTIAGTKTFSSTISGNISGTAGNVTGVVAIANGGTGLTTAPTNGQVDVGNGTGFTRTTIGTSGVGISVANGAGSITLANTGVTSFNGSTGAVTGVGTVLVTAPITNTGSATAPNLGITQATTTTNGYLSSTDWNTFNNKGSGSVTNIATGTGLSGGPITTTGTISLANTAVTAGTYGSSTAIPTLTVNAQGQITSASTAAVTDTVNSGTTNYVARYTGATSLGTGSLYDNGTSVGVGTATPGAKLEVNSGVANTSGLKLTDLTSASPATTTGVNFLGVDGNGNIVMSTLGGQAACNASGSAAAKAAALATCQSQFANCVDDGSGSIIGYVNGQSEGANCDAVGQWAAYCYIGGADSYNCSTCINGQIQAAHNPCTCGNNTAQIGTYCGGSGIPYVDLVNPQTVGGVKTFGSQIASTVATGTAPLSVTSTTLVSNLNSQYLNGVQSTGFNQGIGAGTGITVSGALPSQTVGLSNTGVAAGTYGSGTAVPTFTVNAQGQVTSATTTPVSFTNYWTNDGTYINANTVTNGALTINNDPNGAATSQTLGITGYTWNVANTALLRVTKTGDSGTTTGHSAIYGSADNYGGSSWGLNYSSRGLAGVELAGSEGGSGYVSGVYGLATSGGPGAKAGVFGAYGATTDVTPATWGALAYYDGSSAWGVYSTGNVASSGYVSITEAQDGSGNLRFSAANPYIVASSYIVMPGGLYVNGGTFYAQNQANFRGGVNNDQGTLSLTASNAIVTVNEPNFYMNSRSAIQDLGDNWLRLNQNNNYTNGTYTPYFLRADGGITSGAISNAGAGYFNASSGYCFNGSCYTSAAALGNAATAWAPTSGSGNYIQNGVGAQTANYNITGSATVGSLTSNTYGHFAGVANFSVPASQGYYPSWNTTGGGGETDFINNQGGGAGGFNFYNIAAGGGALGSPIVSITSGGQIKITGGSPAAGKVLTSDANGLGTWSSSGIQSGGVIFTEQAGPLPLSKTFTTNGGNIMLTLSGSGYVAAAGTISATVTVDGTTVATLKGYSNEINSHKAMPSTTVVVPGLAAGTHTLAIANGAGTTTDPNDPYSASYIESPGFSGVTPVVFSQAMSGGETAAQCTAWTTFQAAISATSTYSTVTISGSNDPTGRSCTGAGANTLCQALRSNTATSVTCNGFTWMTGSCGAGLEISTDGTICSCNGAATYDARACINVGNPNWGGVNTIDCNAAAQTLTVTCK